jgi:hypothetical protein
MYLLDLTYTHTSYNDMEISNGKLHMHLHSNALQIFSCSSGRVKHHITKCPSITKHPLQTKNLMMNIFHHPFTFKGKLITKHLAKDKVLGSFPII